MEQSGLICLYCQTKYNINRFPCILDCRDIVCKNCAELFKQHNLEKCPLCGKNFNSTFIRRHEMIFNVVRNQNDQNRFQNYNDCLRTYLDLKQEITNFNNFSLKLDEISEAFNAFQKAGDIEDRLENESIQEKLEIIRESNLFKYKNVNFEEVKNLVEVFAEDFIKVNEELLAIEELKHLQ